MRKKILIYFTAAIIFSVIVSIITVTVQTRHFYKKDIESTLKNIAGAVDKQLLVMSNADFSYLAGYYSDIYSNDDMHIRVTFISTDGKILGESDHDQSLMENHLDRKEVSDALSEGSGSSVRYSSTLGTDLMYTAVYSDLNDVIIRIAVPVTYIARINRSLVGLALASAAAALFVSMLLAYSLSGNITRPIKAFSDTSLEIYRGNLEKRVVLKDHYGEIETLAYIFNSMADRIQENIERLKDDNIRIMSIINAMTEGLLLIDENMKIVLINDIMKTFFGLDPSKTYRGAALMDTVRNKKINAAVAGFLTNGSIVTQELKIPGEKKDTVYSIYTAPLKTEGRSLPGVLLYMQDITERRRLEQIRSDFVSNVTHELKTPLTSIRGFIDTLKSGAIHETDAALRFVDIIEMESERLSALINDILALSEIEHGSPLADLREYNLYRLIENIYAVHENIFSMRKVSFINDIPDDIKIVTDEKRFGQVFTNIIGNAVKYNNEGGYVKVSCDIYKGLIEIRVEDNGIGIMEKDLDRIFERFYRADKGRPKSEGSTGLGLSIAKHAAKILNGDIKVKSRKGTGSKFTVSLPY